MKTQKYLLVLVGAASMSSAAYSMNMDLSEIKENAVKTATKVAKFSKDLVDNNFDAVKSYLAENDGYLFTPAALEAIVNALEQAQLFVHNKLAMIPMKDVEAAGLIPEQVVAGLKAAVEFSGKSLNLQPMVEYLSQIKLSPENFTKFVNLLKEKASQLDLSKVRAALEAMEANRDAFKAAVDTLGKVKAAIPGQIAANVEIWWNNKENPAVWDDIQEKVMGEAMGSAVVLQRNSDKFAKVLESFAQFAVSIADLAKQVVSVYGPVLADAVPAREKTQIKDAIKFVKDHFGDIKEKVSPVIDKVKGVVSKLK